MKFRSLFHTREKFSASTRSLNPFTDYLSENSTPGCSKHSSHSTNHSWKHLQAGIDGLFDQQHRQLMEAFRIIDKNRDGKISEQELKAMWASFGEHVTDKELRFMVQEVDVNGDGQIDFHEFVTLNRRVGLGIEDADKYAEELQLAFIMADANRDGRISAEELQKVMKVLGIKKVTMTESCAMIRCVDSDYDDLINFQEFESLMTSSIFGSNKH